MNITDQELLALLEIDDDLAPQHNEDMLLAARELYELDPITFARTIDLMRIQPHETEYPVRWAMSRILNTQCQYRDDSNWSTHELRKIWGIHTESFLTHRWATSQLLNDLHDDPAGGQFPAVLSPLDSYRLYNILSGDRNSYAHARQWQQLLEFHASGKITRDLYPQPTSTSERLPRTDPDYWRGLMVLQIIIDDLSAWRTANWEDIKEARRLIEWAGKQDNPASIITHARERNTYDLELLEELYNQTERAPSLISGVL